MKQIQILVLTIAVVGLLSGIAAAAPSFLSTSGLILTPDDTVLGPGQFSASVSLFDFDDNVTTFGANVGVTESLELGLTRVDPDVTGVDAETLFNAKYLVLPETATRPSLAVGGVDIAGELDPDGNGGFYAVIGKNLTPIATGMTGEPVNPIRGYIGIGTGIYNGVFGGIDWTLSPKVKVVAEYINEMEATDLVSEKSIFNVGIRLSITDSLTLDAASINGDDFAYGLSFVKIGL